MPYRYRVLILLFFLILVTYFDRLCIAVAGPRIQADLGLSPSDWGWVIGAFTLAYAMFEIPSGLLGDRIGPRKVLTRIVLWWSAFTALTGTVTGLPMMLAIRFAFGAGEAGAFPNATSVVARWIPARERARSSSVFWMATSAGAIFTPLIVVPLEQTYGWRTAFYLFGSLGLFWAALWYLWFRDTPWEMRGVSTAEREAIGRLAPPHHTGVPWGKLFRNRTFLELLAMYHCYCWGAYFYLSWLHTYLQLGRHLSENEMKVAAAIPGVAAVLGILAGGFLSDSLARRHSLRFARCSIGAVSLIGSGGLMFAVTVTPHAWTAVILLALGLGVMNAMLPVAWSLCVDLGREHSGALSGAMNTAGQLGSFLSSVAFGYLVQFFGSYDLALVPLASMLVVSGVLFALIDPSRELLPDDFQAAGSRPGGANPRAGHPPRTSA